MFPLAANLVKLLVAVLALQLGQVLQVFHGEDGSVVFRDVSDDFLLGAEALAALVPGAGVVVDHAADLFQPLLSSLFLLDLGRNLDVKDSNLTLAETAPI